jgi:MraZ protein
MSIPARHRDALALQCEGRLTLTKHPDGCLLMYPRHACDVEMDSAGRILVAPELRDAVGLGREVVLSGMLTHFEIWDPAKRAENEQQTIDVGMPDALSDFSF